MKMPATSATNPADQIGPTSPGNPSTRQERPLKPALIRTLKLKCPECGKGALFHHYLTLNESCPECGESFSHARADNGPAFLTMFVLANSLGVLTPMLWIVWRMDPMYQLMIVIPLAAALSLLLLPRSKGLIVGWQWAKRMHGF